MLPGRARQFVHIMFISVGIFGRHQVQKHKASLGVLAMPKTTSEEVWQFVHILFSFFSFGRYQMLKHNLLLEVMVNPKINLPKSLTNPQIKYFQI